ncbi:MAG: hypothetical protein WD267_14275 [Balneolales bacterium]
MTDYPRPKFHPGKAITNGERVMVIDFSEWSKEHQEYYYYQRREYKSFIIMESDAELTEMPEREDVKLYKQFFGNKKKTKE